MLPSNAGLDWQMRIYESQSGNQSHVVGNWGRQSMGPGLGIPLYPKPKRVKLTDSSINSQSAEMGYHGVHPTAHGRFPSARLAGCPLIGAIIPPVVCLVCAFRSFFARGKQQSSEISTKKAISIFLSHTDTWNGVLVQRVLQTIALFFSLP